MSPAPRHLKSVVDSIAGTFPPHQPRASPRRAGKARQIVLRIVLFQPPGPAEHSETVLGSASYARRVGTHETYAATTADVRPRDGRQGTLQTCRRNVRQP